MQSVWLPGAAGKSPAWPGRGRPWVRQGTQSPATGQASLAREGRGLCESPGSCSDITFAFLKGHFGANSWKRARGDRRVEVTGCGESRGPVNPCSLQARAGMAALGHPAPAPANGRDPFPLSSLSPGVRRAASAIDHGEGRPGPPAPKVRTRGRHLGLRGGLQIMETAARRRAC